ncbi:adhesion G protein-coupled receptor E1-like [Pseudophryne corroboree]|uniref:adhesion G protein-coupled receptor E1-like n=1 Tax=Pseudophryne corroboree TaxID=495146 RepID=UPI0030819B5C
MNQCPGEKETLLDETRCGNGWICPLNSGCVLKTKCHCEKGYYPCVRKGVRVCRDKNECKKDHGCGDRATCKNTKGSYYCECNRQYHPQNVSQFCPGREPQNYCRENKVMQKCKSNISQLENLGKCARPSAQNEICSLLQTTFDLLNSSCMANNRTISNEDADKELINATEALTQHLNHSEISSIDPQRGIFITSFLDNVETITLLSFTAAPRNQNISTPNIDISIKASYNDCRTGAQYTTLVSSTNIMKIPCSLVPGEQDGAIFITYNGLELRLNGNISNNPGINSFALANSRVVTAATTNPGRENLSSAVTFRLSTLKDLEPFHKSFCVFWDPNRNDWNEEGCITESYIYPHTTCTCTHFSSFAVIMAPYGIEEVYGLVILSQVGLSVSLVCLCLSLLTFILCRSIRSIHNSVLATLCGCLFLGQLLILIGLLQTFNKVLCSVIAGGLHFIFLCAFCWMFIESILLFMTVRNLQALNYMTSRRSNFPVMCLVGFGVPAVIVGISAAVQPRGYGTEKYCWLRPSLTWSFLGPVCVFITVNTILLVVTVLFLQMKLTSINTNVSSLKNSRILAFKALAQVFILGCTWSIGFFQFGPASLVISYIFTICVCLQGPFIFLVHCLLNHQVTAEYRKLFRRLHTRSKQASDASTSGSVQTVNMYSITKPTVNTEAPSSEKTASWV